MGPAERRRREGEDEHIRPPAARLVGPTEAGETLRQRFDKESEPEPLVSVVEPPERQEGAAPFECRGVVARTAMRVDEPAPPQPLTAGTGAGGHVRGRNRRAHENAMASPSGTARTIAAA